MGASEFDDTVNGDLLFSLGSILIVLCFITVHTGSFFLGGFGMLQILMSMPASLFIYRTVCGVDFITQLHVLSVYLVLGIGADDLFVFYDAWLQVSPCSKHGQSCRMMALITSDCGVMRSRESNRPDHDAWLQSAYEVPKISCSGRSAAALFLKRSHTEVAVRCRLSQRGRCSRVVP